MRNSDSLNGSTLIAFLVLGAVVVIRTPPSSRGSTLIMLLVVVAVMITLQTLGSGRLRSVMQAWADANGYKILHSRLCGLFQFMPLGWIFSTTRYQFVYHVAVYDESSHRIRSGWVRLGTRWGKWGGFASDFDGDAIEVKWEHEG